ncbi:nucleotidyltransferase domain-containing protein [Catellatospora citrea]|uniref:Nucleotidyltransferase n=1 Tax=Catellatospora citrea TaxID=53366 RepID=A0A8J3KTA6_9ACTN|nr:nucleotidyltransferase [Catellatospora citrea]RKE09082.1 nucleotidyltransferase-like protein [Catellatospora citrea]GIG03024.1 nucleotidyltransferase [Catellatospora citrea]
MAVSDIDMRAWTNQGAQDAMQKTYASVQAALDRSDALQNLGVEVFLQGSYANATNTRGDSDVDIVVMTNMIFQPDITRLSEADKTRYNRNRSAAGTTFQQFRSLVERALLDYYGSARVHPKTKCIRVDKQAGYVDADVVPAFEHRLYTSYPENGSPVYIEGISIRPTIGGSITNYPKVHKKNGRLKNGRCLDLYKPTVRQVKRLRRRAVEQGLMTKDVAPGYLLECMVYNAPNTLFESSDSARLRSVVAWLAKHDAQALREFNSCDEVHKLFVDDPGRHKPEVAARVIDILRGMI